MKYSLKEIAIAKKKARECDCIVCAMTLINEKSARLAYRQAVKDKKEISQRWWTMNWEMSISQLMLLAENPKKFHLQGTPVEGHRPFMSRINKNRPTS